MRRGHDPDAERDRLAGRPPGGTYDAAVRFEVLGPLRVVAGVGSGGRAATVTEPALGGPKQRLVLALLLADPGRVVSLERLVDGLWGDDPPESARHTVQSYVSELRKALGPVIERDGSGYRVDVDRSSLDSLEFEAGVAEARASATHDPAAAAARYAAALSMWHGPAFADFRDNWALQLATARLDELHLAAVEEWMQARLDCGQHGGAIVELERLTREHPYREELRALHMVALYRSGRQADALRAFQATRDVLADELGIVPSPRLRRLEEQILLQDPDLDAPPARTAEADHPRAVDNPYLGLRAFREADHARFFGQDEIVQRLVARVVAEARFTAVVGPSGSGKSSAVQAGLVPRLRAEHPDVRIAQMQPGPQPFASLEAALERVEGAPAVPTAIGSARDPARAARDLAAWAGHVRAPLLLVIDQFEELFTVVDDAEAARFLSLLADVVSAADGRVSVLVTLRADFYDRPLADARFGRVFAENVVNVVALGPAQLEAAATLPARQVDITVEPRLVGRLIADVAGQPNALPLFQYALTELFDAREAAVLDLATYERIGGVRRAVARRAESLYGQLDPVEQETARQLFLRIATVSGDLVGRRRVPASELVSLDVDVIALRAVIDLFARYRLLALDRDPATGSPTVEVAHEALLAEWHRLRDWIDEHRDDLARQAAFMLAVEEWEQAGRDPGYLLRGSRLDGYARWVGTTRLRLTATEHDFVTASLAARDAESAALLEREQSQVRLRRRTRRQLVALFAVIAALAAAVSYPLLRPDARRESIAVVFDVRSDQSAFEALILRGLEAAGADHGFDTVVLEPPFTDLEADVRRVATGSTLMFGTFGIGALLVDVAPDHPDTTFAIVDAQGPPPERDNVVAVSFAAEEGSFLVGAAAALESATGRIGYIGANSLPHIEAFRAGFEQGARAADPDVEVAVELIQPRSATGEDAAGGYLDPDVAHELAVSMFGAGVDVIYVAAGQSGEGVVRAAAELSTPDRHLWAVGVDTDQYFDLTTAEREHVLTSMVKRIDQGVSAVVAAFDAGTLVVPGTVRVALADDAVGYTDSGGHLSAATIEALESYRSEIVEGRITVGDRPQEPPPTVVHQGATRLDLRTGEHEPLPDAIADAPFYVVSPDGTAFATGTCCGYADRITIADLDGTDRRDLEALASRSHYLGGWSPDGRRFVYQERTGADWGDLGHIAVQDLASGRVTEVTAVGLRAMTAPFWLAPVFAADGRSILFHLPRADEEDTASDVWSVPVDGGEPTLVVEDGGLAQPFADGERIAFVAGMRQLGGDNVSILEADGSIRRLVTAEDSIVTYWISPDGTRIAYLDGTSIRVADVATGAWEEVATGRDVAWLDDHTLVVVPG